MNTPTEAQLNDPKWWDENAPEGAEIVWLVWNGAPRVSNLARVVWAKRGEGVITVTGQEVEHFYHPEAPESKEWDGNTIIAAGHRLEARVDKNPRLSGEVAYRSDSGVVFRPDDGGDELFWRFALFNVEFRPIRTREQREREEMVRSAAHAIEMKNGSPITLYLKYCEDLYDAGMLRKAGEK